MLHRLGIVPALGVSCRRTNLIASVMARRAETTARVNYSKTSDQKLLWFGAALLAEATTFRSVKARSSCTCS